MNCAIKKLQEDINKVINAWLILKEEAVNIDKTYWSCGVDSEISGIDPVTVNSKLTNTEFVSGITLVQQFDKFFTNQAVTQSDYLSICENITHGNDTASSIVSEACETLGDRMVRICVDSIVLFKKCKNILELYNSNEVPDMIENLDNQRVVSCNSLTKDDLVLGITLVEQFKKLLNNEAVTAGDYASTLAKWQRL